MVAHPRMERNRRRYLFFIFCFPVLSNLVRQPPLSFQIEDPYPSFLPLGWILDMRLVAKRKKRGYDDEEAGWCGDEGGK